MDALPRSPARVERLSGREAHTKKVELNPNWIDMVTKFADEKEGPTELASEGSRRGPHRRGRAGSTGRMEAVQN